MFESITRTALCAFVLSVSTAVIVTAAGAQSASPANPFAKAKGFTCTFPIFAAARWAGGTPEPLNGNQEFAFKIEGIDYKKNQARVVASGTVPVTVRLAPTGLNVIEQTPIGNFILTTIFTSGANGKKFLAVHSRHLGETTELPRTSQNYGTCELTE